MILRLAATLFLTAWTLAASAQFVTDSIVRYNHLVSASVTPGIILQTNDFLRGDNVTGQPMRHQVLTRAAFGWQTLGHKDWEIVHRLPSFGIGVATAFLDNKDEIGQPISLYGFYNGVFKRWDNHEFKYNIETGVAFHWKSYNLHNNPNNISIGSKLTAHVGLNLEYSYTFADRLVVGLGAGVTHFSNGAIRKPNKGINLFGGQLKLAYLLNDIKRPTHLPKVDKIKGNELDITIGYGIKRFEIDTLEYPGTRYEYEPKIHYNILTLQALYLHRYCHKGKYGGGFSFLYDDFMGSDLHPADDGHAILIHGAVHKRFAIATMVAHEFCISRLSVVTQIGYYLLSPTDVVPKQTKEPLFQRAGIKYTFPCNIHAGVHIYAHRLSVADFIEWNIGYSFNFKRKTA